MGGPLPGAPHRQVIPQSPESPAEIQALEDMRCAALGNSFHTNTVAILFDQVLGGIGIKKPKGVKRIVSDFIQKEGLKRKSVVAAETIPEDDVDEEGVDPEEDDSLSQAGHEFMRKLQEASEDFPTDEELQERAKNLSVKLVSAFPSAPAATSCHQFRYQR